MFRLLDGSMRLCVSPVAFQSAADSSRFSSACMLKLQGAHGLNAVVQIESARCSRLVGTQVCLTVDQHADLLGNRSLQWLCVCFPFFP